MVNIDTLIKKLTKKYTTNNPFELAKCLNIIIFSEPLGEINGYYNTIFRQKQIHINSELPEQKKRFTCAHELGHALMHPKENTPFLRGSTFFSVNKLEIEANTFAVKLLIPDEVLKENNHLTTYQIASLCGIDEKLIQLRLKN
jgi:Zn-dependent peptidase ImmA (M78 family)